jgi:hypothetical protein
VTPPPEWTEAKALHYGFGRLDVSRKSVTFRMILEKDDSVADTLVVNKDR